MLQENYNIGAEGCRALRHVLPGMHSLTELNLAKNNIGPKGARYLAEALEDGATLYQSLAKALANEPDRAAVNKKLAAFAGLQYLELEWCKLKTEGVAALGAAMANICSSNSSSSSGGGGGGGGSAKHGLMRLGLARNGAGDRGVKVGGRMPCFVHVRDNLCIRSLHSTTTPL